MIFLFCLCCTFSIFFFFFFFSSRRRHTRWNCDWSSDVCSSDPVLTNDVALARSVRAQALREPPQSWPDLARRFATGYGARVAVSPKAFTFWGYPLQAAVSLRSEERRVGKECRAGGWGEYWTKRR